MKEEAAEMADLRKRYPDTPQLMDDLMTDLHSGMFDQIQAEVLDTQIKV